jgi:hypothetical protein
MNNLKDNIIHLTPEEMQKIYNQSLVNNWIENLKTSLVVTDIIKFGAIGLVIYFLLKK